MPGLALRSGASSEPNTPCLWVDSGQSRVLGTISESSGSAGLSGNLIPMVMPLPSHWYGIHYRQWILLL